MKATVLAFDCFGTVFDLAGVDPEAVRRYSAHVRKEEWEPLDLIGWELLPAHPDAAEGIKRLRTKHRVVTCSNCPADVLAPLSRRNGIHWDAIIPLESIPAYKPNNPQSYLNVARVMGCGAEEVMLVTSNEKFGDLEATAALGMQSLFLNRNGGKPSTIIELAEMLGC